MAMQHGHVGVVIASAKNPLGDAPLMVTDAEDEETLADLLRLQQAATIADVDTIWTAIGRLRRQRLLDALGLPGPQYFRDRVGASSPRANASRRGGPKATQPQQDGGVETLERQPPLLPCGEIVPPIGSRGLAYLALSALAFVFLMAAFATNVGSSKEDQSSPSSGLSGSGPAVVTKKWFDIWYMCERQGDANVAVCVDSADSELPCVEAKDSFRGARCFYVLTAILIMVSFVAAIVDHLHPVAPLRRRVLLVALSGMTVFVSLIAWAVALSLPRTEYCNQPKMIDQPKFAWGASPFLMLIVMIIAIVQVVAALLIGDVEGAGVVVQRPPQEGQLQKAQHQEQAQEEQPPVQDYDYDEKTQPADIGMESTDSQQQEDL